MLFFLIFGVHGWDYKNHGSDWTNGVCQTASNQSPRDIGTYSTISSGNLWYLNVRTYKAATVSQSTGISYSLNNYFSITGDFGYATKEGTADPDGSAKYTIDSIEFHVPAEHSINNVTSDMEVQIYHSSSTSDTYLVFSVFFNSVNDPEYERKFFIDVLNANSTATEVNPIDLTGGYYDIKQFYQYFGSESKPDCATAEWILYQEPFSLYSDQFNKFKNLLQSGGFSGNYRSQEINTNIVSLYLGVYESGKILLMGLAYYLV